MLELFNPTDLTISTVFSNHLDDLLIHTQSLL